MAGRKKHPNEYNLTRWAIARMEAVAGDRDNDWLKAHEPDFWRERSRYRRGLITTQWRERSHLAQRLGERFPWFPDIFTGALGQILMGKSLTVDEIKKAIRALGSPYDALLLSGTGLAQNGGERSAFLIDDIFLEFENYPNLATLEAMVYIWAWADRDQNHETWNGTCNYYHWMLSEFEHEGLLPFHSALFDAIDCYALYRTFHANGRQEHKFSWRQGLGEVKRIRQSLETGRDTWKPDGRYRNEGT